MTGEAQLHTSRHDRYHVLHLKLMTSTNTVLPTQKHLPSLALSFIHGEQALRAYDATKELHQMLRWDCDGVVR
jgi:hypothetical protein